MRNEDQNTNINLFLEIDTEKRVVCISDKKDNKGCAKRYRYKRDIARIFSRYLYYNVNIFPPKDDWVKKYNGRKKHKKYQEKNK